MTNARRGTDARSNHWTRNRLHYGLLDPPVPPDEVPPDVPPEELLPVEPELLPDDEPELLFPGVLDAPLVDPLRGAPDGSLTEEPLEELPPW